MKAFLLVLLFIAPCFSIANPATKHSTKSNRSTASTGDFTVFQSRNTKVLEQNMKKWCDPNKPYQFFLSPVIDARYGMICIGK